MTAFLVDEMFPTAAAGLLRDTYGHDAVHVAEVGLRAADDAQVAAVARADGRVVVTKNVADFSAERDVVLVFVLKKNPPAGGGQAAALAKILDRWAQAHPGPYLGPHWPSVAEQRGRLPEYRSEIIESWGTSKLAPPPTAPGFRELCRYRVAPGPFPPPAGAPKVTPKGANVA